MEVWIASAVLAALVILGHKIIRLDIVAILYGVASLFFVILGLLYGKLY